MVFHTMGTTLSKAEFLYTGCKVYMAPRSRTVTSSYVHNLGGPGEPCTIGVRFRKRTYHFTSPCEQLWSYGSGSSHRHRDHSSANGIFVLRLCGCVRLPDCACSMATIGCVHKLELTSTWCTRCTIAEAHMAFDTSIGTTLVQTAFLYTRCIDVHGTPTTYGYHRLSSQFCRFHRALYCRCTIPQTSMALRTSMGTTLV